MICDADLVIGGSWGREDTIIFSNGEVIYQVPTKGGEAKALTRLDSSRGETTHNKTNGLDRFCSSTNRSWQPGGLGMTGSG